MLSKKVVKIENPTQTIAGVGFEPHDLQVMGLAS